MKILQKYIDEILKKLNDLYKLSHTGQKIGKIGSGDFDDPREKSKHLIFFLKSYCKGFSSSPVLEYQLIINMKKNTMNSGPGKLNCHIQDKMGPFL